MSADKNRLKVFLSYSHSDWEWVERLLAHLSQAESKGLIEYWSDQEIQPGEDIERKIKKSIAEAKVFVIFANPDYMASSFLTEFELPLIKKALKAKTLILPVRVKPIASATINGFDDYKWVNEEAISLLSPRKQEELIIELAAKINAAILDHKQKIEAGSSQVLASAIGGAIFGNLLLPGMMGALLGGVLGGAVGKASRG